ncbi:uncharacterized protein G2W53_044976 [Senna tora]|uniref:Uncharacterized protein n=1 Tax=Senna tora TaxID=362788 RepID=A0A834SCI0_9FABA|nr:uncharacterized protein G2W53_044976 [Senna tora]
MGERGSCLNIFRTKSQSDLRNLRITRKRLVAQSSWHGRSVDHVLTYSDDKSRSDLRNLHDYEAKVLVAQVSQTRRFAFVFANRSGLMLRLESSGMGGA